MIPTDKMYMTRPALFISSGVVLITLSIAMSLGLYRASLDQPA